MRFNIDYGFLNIYRNNVQIGEIKFTSLNTIQMEANIRFFDHILFFISVHLKKLLLIWIQHRQSDERIHTIVI